MVCVNCWVVRSYIQSPNLESERKKKRTNARRGWEVIVPRMRDTRCGNELAVTPEESDHKAKRTGT
jgi:hypothetical protein